MMQKPGAKSFPATPEDAELAKQHLVKMVFKPEVRARIVALLKQGGQQAASKIGEIIGMMVFRIVASAKEKSGGKVHIKLALGLIKQAVGKVEKIMAVTMKKRMPDKMKQAIAQIAGGVVEKMIKQGGQQPPQQQPPQQPQQPQMGQPQQPQQPGGLLNMGGA